MKPVKVTLHPDGKLDFEVDGPKEAATLARALQGKREAKEREHKHAVERVRLAPQQEATWAWLVAHDRPTGQPVDQLARELEISHSAATGRLQGLLRLGVVHKVKRGHYRAGEPQLAIETQDTPKT